MQARWITLARFSTVHEAEVARGLLEAAGIEANLLDSEMMNLAWHLAPALGGVRLQVHPEDRQAAIAILTGEDPEYGPKLVVIEGGASDALRRREDAEEDRGDSDPDALLEWGDAADLEAQRLARRALGAALLGLLVPIALHLYSAWLLLELARSRGALDRRSRAWAAMALAIDALVLVPTLLFLAERLL